MTAAEWHRLLVELDVACDYHSVPCCLHVYCVVCDAKEVSPLLEDGVFTLAICGTACRASVRKTMTSSPNSLAAVMALYKGCVNAVYVVGSLIPARKYHDTGIAGHALVPEIKQPSRGRGRPKKLAKTA